MLNIFKLAFVLASAALCLANLDPKSCRRCHGTFNVNLNLAVSKQDAVNYVVGTLGRCATNAEIDIGVPTTPGCSPGGACKVWSFPVTAWRYCGNGGLVSLDKTNQCNGGLCGNTTLRMGCDKSVVCHSDCNCVECGC